MEWAVLSRALWLLFAGALFFLAMRRATGDRCGTAGPIERDSPRNRADRRMATPPAAVRDPVCGMTVAPSDDIRWIHRGVSYYFCSLACRGRFRASPEEYVGPRATNS